MAWPRGGLDKPRVRRGERLRRNVAVLRCGVATVHSMEIFVFCFILFCFSIAPRTCLSD